MSGSEYRPRPSLGQRAAIFSIQAWIVLILQNFDEKPTSSEPRVSVEKQLEAVLSMEDQDQPKDEEEESQNTSHDGDLAPQRGLELPIERDDAEEVLIMSS